MRIRFDSGLILGGEDYHLQSIEGLETPVVRNGDGLYAGSDGGFVVSQYYNMRTITLKGFFLGSCSTQAETLRQEMLRRLPLRYQFGITIEDFNQQYWFVSGYVSDIKCSITAPKVGEYQLTILCPDPLIYQATGWLTDTPLSITQPLEVNGSTTFLAQGTAQTFPVFRFTGKWGNPYGVTIEGTSFQLNTTTEGTVYINMKEHTAKYADNVSVLKYRAVDSMWLPLLPGAVTITTYGQSGGSNPDAKLIYQPAYRGI